MRLITLQRLFHLHEVWGSFYVQKSTNISIFLQFLDGTTNEDETVKFLSPTEWPSPVTWPVCLEIVESCTVLPDSLDNTFTNLTSLPVDVDETVTYACEEKGKMISLIKQTKLIFNTRSHTLITLTCFCLF